jgi:hypothetical protein
MSANDAYLRARRRRHSHRARQSDAEPEEEKARAPIITAGAHSHGVPLLYGEKTPDDFIRSARHRGGGWTRIF